MGEQLTAALVAAIVSALVSLVVALFQLRQARNSQRNQVQHDITAKYDRMVDYRLQRPEVLDLARKWNQDCFKFIYDHSGPEGNLWAIYYGYVELLIFYCNAVLHAKARGHIDVDVYESQHEALIKLLLAEHYPILSTIIRPGGYVTKYLVEHVEDLQRGGWKWAAAYEDLATYVPETE